MPLKNDIQTNFPKMGHRFVMIYFQYNDEKSLLTACPNIGFAYANAGYRFNVSAGMHHDSPAGYALPPALAV